MMLVFSYTSVFSACAALIVFLRKFAASNTGQPEAWAGLDRTMADAATTHVVLTFRKVAEMAFLSMVGSFG
uniref:Uncharacterized protein n=1 Tax=Ralstonia solanacearum TaxID=305 RepID=A0A0S4UBM8_RALSL|nr:protein of unknown function [Ralstonia solanacearum]